MINVILLIVLIIIAMGTGAVTVLLINRNRVRLADDPMSNPYGDVPGFSVEQFRVARRPYPSDHLPQSPGVALRVKGGGAGFPIPSGRRRRSLIWWRS